MDLETLTDQLINWDEDRYKFEIKSCIDRGDEGLFTFKTLNTIHVTSVNGVLFEGVRIDVDEVDEIVDRETSTDD